LGPTIHPIPRVLESFTEGRATGIVRLSAELNVVPMLRIRIPHFSFTPLKFFHDMGSTNLNFV